MKTLQRSEQSGTSYTVKTLHKISWESLRGSS